MNINTENPCVAGMDIGGTNTVFGIVDAQGNILCRDSVKTQEYPVIEEYIDAVCEKLICMVREHVGPNNLKGLGIGAPNGNYYSGCIEQAANLPWKGVVPIASMFSEKIGLRVVLTNDAKAAALGEMTYGAARGMKDFIMITLGTGVGSGIIVNGQLVYGYDGFAGELGHVMVRPGGRRCGCGRNGCLETYCSATGIVRTAREMLLASTEPSLLHRVPIEDLTSIDLYDAAVKDDKLALEIFRFTGTVLGEALANFVLFSRPEAIILFGGLAKAGNFILEPTQAAMEANMYNVFKGKVKLLFSELKDADAAILGASVLAWEAK